MKNVSPFDMLKNNGLSNASQWLKETDIISYGAVIEVLSDSIVKVEEIVRNGTARKIYNVTLLSGSSSLSEELVEPKIGDLVMLLFVNRYNRNMFDAPSTRDELSIYDADATGYNKFSGVGILMAPGRGFAETVVRHYLDGAVPNRSMRTRAVVQEMYRREVRSIYDAMPDEGGFVDRPIERILGVHNPALDDYRAKYRRLHGFSVLSDKTLEDFDATVEEFYSPNAPIIKNIQAAQTITIGKGFDPAGDFGGGTQDVDAPIDVTIGSQADLTVTSDSGLSMTFEKAVLLKSNDTFKIEAQGKITIAGQDAIEITAGAMDLLKIGNGIDTLGAMISDLADTLAAADSIIVSGGSGAPAVGAPNPAFVTKVNLFKAKWGAVFE
jgi:hypothetical protein